MKSVARARGLLTASRAGWRSQSRRRVVFISGEPDWAGHNYRVLNIASALPARSFETVVIRLDELWERLGELHPVDVLWVWRSPYLETLAKAIDEARAAGARIICDVDDLVFEPELARRDVVDGLRTQNYAPEDFSRHVAKVRRSLLEADHCTVSTAPLARELERLGLPTTIMPNGFDADFFRAAERARSRRRAEAPVVRVGYAAGTFTHQRDLAVAAPALAQILRDNENVRFVTTEAVDISEFPELSSRATQVELRPLVPFDQLPLEYARFHVSIAPLEVGNPFCEAKSEVKYIEAALVGVGTVASPTEPFTASIRHGETGFLADDDSWYEALSRLVADERLRDDIAANAHRDVLTRFGPERRTRVVTDLLERLLGRNTAGYVAMSSRHTAPSAEEAREAAPEGVQTESGFARSYQVRYTLFRAMRAVGMPVYDLGMRMGLHWLEPMKDRIFEALFRKK
jgi:glycosyltransferase involved in cell wall biosynthesis